MHEAAAMADQDEMEGIHDAALADTENAHNKDQVP